MDTLEIYIPAGTPCILFFIIFFW